MLIFQAYASIFNHSLKITEKCLKLNICIQHHMSMNDVYVYENTVVALRFSNTLNLVEETL